MLYAKDLIQTQSEKKKMKKEIFKLILEDIYTKIKRKNNDGIRFLKIVIPLMKIGYPLYNIHTAVAYICDKLQKGGFQISILDTNTLEIKW